MTIDPVLDATLRVTLALLFAHAVRHKLAAPRAFAAAVRGYRLVPDALAPAIAGVLVAAEVAVVALLAMPATRRAGAYGVVLLLGSYALAIAVNLRRGRRDLDCGCMGPGAATPIHGGLVGRNAVLAAGALVVALPAGERSMRWLDAVTVVASAVTLAAVYAAVDRLMANRPAVARARGVA